MPTQQEVQQASQKLQQVIQSSGVNPEIIVNLGKLAHSAVKDKALYPMFVKQLVDYKLIEPGEMSQKIDYSALSFFVALGKVAEKMTGAA